jgi:hypothetical protein
MDKGTEDAIEYVKKNVLPKWGFGLTHMVLHKVGEASYYKTTDLHQSLAYIEPYMSDQDINTDGFDGYMHGVFRGYFKMNQSTPTEQLMKTVCGEYYGMQMMEDDLHTHHGSKAEECFHGIGHALMYLHDSEIDPARQDCHKTSQIWMRNACLRGVFMEETYKYSDFLSEVDTPVQENSMQELCNQFNDEEGRICAGFVGESYMLKNKTDLEGGFNECKKLRTSQMKQSCIDMMAILFLPFHYKSNLAQIIEVCQKWAGEFGGRCLYSANEGIKIGNAGPNNKNQSICSDIKDPSLEKICLTGKKTN